MSELNEQEKRKYEDRLGVDLTVVRSALDGLEKLEKEVQLRSIVMIVYAVLSKNHVSVAEFEDGLRSFAGFMCPCDKNNGGTV